MIKEILQLMASGKLSLSEMSSELSITNEELKNRLELMRHLGYVEILCETTSKSNGKMKCSCCPQQKSCSESTNRDKFGISYGLTNKGKRVSKK